MKNKNAWSTKVKLIETSVKFFVISRAVELKLKAVQSLEIHYQSKNQQTLNYVLR